MSGNEERRLIDFTPAPAIRESDLVSARQRHGAFRIACRRRAGRRPLLAVVNYEGRGVRLEESEEKE